MPTSAPAGYHTVTPRIFTRDVPGLAAFISHVFGGTGDVTADRPVEMRVGDSIIILSGTDVRPPMPACLYVYVDDLEATYQRALAAGATSLEEPRDMPYGDRRATMSDAWDNLWQIATRE